MDGVQCARARCSLLEQMKAETMKHEIHHVFRHYDDIGVTVKMPKLGVLGNTVHSCM
jgi:hypothetical protein